MSEPEISIIVPTRGRPEDMLAFLESVRSNAADPGNVQIVVVVDEDDEGSQHLEDPKLVLKTVVVPPGMTMGALNMAGYQASVGRYILLCNDDVRVRTPDWDLKTLRVFKSYPDDVLLVHLNDLIFGKSLCTFPFVTRAYCELAGGICDERYRRYMIDDGVHNVFSMVGALGASRVAYLPDVVFEHFNKTFDADGKLVYVPIPEIHAEDRKLFHELTEARRSLAIALSNRIERFRSANGDEIKARALQPFIDADIWRDVRYTIELSKGKPSEQPRVTVAIVTADIAGKHGSHCLQCVKDFTANYDLIILDNNRGGIFNHSREMNKIIDACGTDHLVLLDDDVFVSEGWLTKMLDCLADDVAVVTPLHDDASGELSYAGVVMHPDASGDHQHNLLATGNGFPVQTICSAIMLIDLRKTGPLRMNEAYTKYFMDIDFGLQVWEAGFQVVVDGSTRVTHLGGATLKYGTEAANKLKATQQNYWHRQWVESGRFAALERDVWSKVPELQTIDPGLLRNPNPEPYGRMKHYVLVEYDNKFYAISIKIGFVDITVTNRSKFPLAALNFSELLSRLGPMAAARPAASRPKRVSQNAWADDAEQEPKTAELTDIPLSFLSKQALVSFVDKGLKWEPPQPVRQASGLSVFTYFGLLIAVPEGTDGNELYDLDWERLPVISESRRQLVGFIKKTRREDLPKVAGFAGGRTMVTYADLAIAVPPLRAAQNGSPDERATEFFGSLTQGAPTKKVRNHQISVGRDLYAARIAREGGDEIEPTELQERAVIFANKKQMDKILLKMSGSKRSLHSRAWGRLMLGLQR